MRLLVGVCLFALLLTVRTLHRAPRGFGTHEELGLARCAMVQFLGMRCPTCGMTTAWAHWVRGHWVEALKASVTGTLLAGAALLGAVAAVLSAAFGVSGPKISMMHLAEGLLVLVSLAVGEWIFRIAIFAWPVLRG